MLTTFHLDGTDPYRRKKDGALDITMNSISYTMKESMKDDQISKRLYNGQVIGNRDRSRPRTNWQDNIQKDT